MISDRAREMLEAEVMEYRSRARNLSYELVRVSWLAEAIEQELTARDPQLMALADDGCPNVELDTGDSTNE